MKWKTTALDIHYLRTDAGTYQLHVQPLSNIHPVDGTPRESYEIPEAGYSVGDTNYDRIVTLLGYEVAEAIKHDGGVPGSIGSTGTDGEWIDWHHIVFDIAMDQRTY